MVDPRRRMEPLRIPVPARRRWTKSAGAHADHHAHRRAGCTSPFHEAALVDYSGMWLRQGRGSGCAPSLTPSSARAEGVAAPRRSRRPGARCRSPTAPAGWSMSNLILNLNEPNKLGDVSWFKPCKYVGVWWEMHLDRRAGPPGPKHGATTENAQALHRLRREARLPRRAGRRLERGLGWRLVRQRRGLQFHQAVSGFRPRSSSPPTRRRRACA